VKTIAFDMSHAAGSLAALQGAIVEYETALPPHRRSAEAVAPALEQLLARLGWRPPDVELVAVGIGPGSFTGLRVAITMARLFAYSVQAKILGIDTFGAVAMLAPQDVQRVWVVVDALRGQMHVAQMVRCGSDGFTPASPARLVDGQRWIESLADEDIVSGPGLEVWNQRIPSAVRVLDSRLWYPSAVSVGQAAARRHAAGQGDDLWSLSPIYGRPSAAEEKRAAAGK
jgi:tRNA threonylcarbamoyl adenosine modification protein YeaZ